MAYTTHPNQLDTKRGLRAGLIGLAVVLFAAVAALGYSVVSHDSETAPVVVDFPTVDEMRAENIDIRDQRGRRRCGARGSQLPVQRRDAGREHGDPGADRGRRAATAATDPSVPTVDDGQDVKQASGRRGQALMPETGGPCGPPGRGWAVRGLLPWAARRTDAPGAPVACAIVNTQMQTCYRHADRRAGVICQRCDRPICPDCMQQASVGFHCPECTKSGRPEDRPPGAAAAAARHPDPGRPSTSSSSPSASAPACRPGTG